MKRLLLAAGLAAMLAACATNPSRTPVQPSTSGGAQRHLLSTARFSDLPGWANADLAPALSAFRRHCTIWRNRTPDASINGAAQYGGQVGTWLPACNAADLVQPGGERTFFETNFTPYSVAPMGGESRLTAYYEPVIQARRYYAPGFTEPLLKRPVDMVAVDLRAFAEALDDSVLRGAPRQLTGQLQGNTVKPYPQRAAIVPYQGQIIGYAHPADVYNLQVQGSGRLQFDDGVQARAAYAAQNGYKWNSALGALSRSGQLPPGGATWAGLKTWMDANGPDASKSALNADPSYVFFAEEPIVDPAMGPRGAANVPLTPMGSIAVDPSYHPYGAVVFVDGTYDGAPFRKLLVAQDTGGAIKRGPQRGDVFFGPGPDAGARAERMNAPARWWTLMPKGVPVS